MRFDYYPPTTKFKSFHLRRLLLTNLILIGVACIVVSFFNGKSNNYTEQKLASNTDNNRPTLIAKSNHKSNSKATLELDTIQTKEPQLAAKAIVANNQIEKWQTITVQVGDTLSNLFDRLGISKFTFKSLMSSSISMDELTKIYPGQKLDFLFDDSKELKEVKFNLSNNKTLRVTNSGSKFKYSYEEHKPSRKINFSTGKIYGSLYSSAQNAGLNDRLIMQMTDIFEYDIDFTLDIRDNDSFKVLYEEESIQNKRKKSSKILAVEFSNQGKTYKAIRYTDEKGHDGYYSPDGYNLQKAFLRNPVEFTRISSHFSSARRHPILHKIRSHKGVDYEAPMGTPVKSAGDGRISFMGTKSGYGKSIEIVHGHKYSTFYAHLSRFNQKVKHGAFVKQGQIIGYVGRTGLATGPHLHYEFRINGVHHNPVTVPLPRSQPISGKNKKDFSLHAKKMLSLLKDHGQTKNE